MGTAALAWTPNQLLPCGVSLGNHWASLGLRLVFPHHSHCGHLLISPDGPGPSPGCRFSREHTRQGPHPQSFMSGVSWWEG